MAMSNEGKGQLKVNYLSEQELRQIPGIGESLARTIVSLRLLNGNIDSELLVVLCRRKLPQSILTRLDFEPNDIYNQALGSVTPPNTIVGRGRDAYDEHHSENTSVHESELDESTPWPTVPKLEHTGEERLMRQLTPSLRFSPNTYSAHTYVEEGNQGSNLPERLSSVKATQRTLPETPAKAPCERQSQQRERLFLKDIPRGMSYDGKGTWQSFELKFLHYVEAMDWTPSQQKMALLHVLNGKALDFCARLMKCEPDITFRDLIVKLDRRFGAEIPASAQAKFHTSMQTKGESVQDWADRVHQLSTDAFFYISEDYCNRQAIDRFCLGLLDVEAGHETYMQMFSSLEDAVNHVNLSLHSKRQMMHKRADPSTRHAAENYDDSVAQVCAINRNASQASDVTSLRREIEELRKDMRRMMSRGSRGRSGRKCWKCGQVGHFQRSCPKEPLNSRESSQRADTRLTREAH